MVIDIDSLAYDEETNEQFKNLVKFCRPFQSLLLVCIKNALTSLKTEDQNCIDGSDEIGCSAKVIFQVYSLKLFS